MNSDVENMRLEVNCQFSKNSEKLSNFPRFFSPGAWIFPENRPWICEKRPRKHRIENRFLENSKKFANFPGFPAEELSFPGTQSYNLDLQPRKSRENVMGEVFRTKNVTRKFSKFLFGKMI